MAGHSKWANIKHRKARQDASRGKVWTKVIREITVAAKGGPDPNDNPRLRLALDKANAANMPKDTIKRAIQKGSGTGEMGVIEELTFEGYGPNGVAILVETMTDNRNRTVADVRHAFSKFGGNMGTDGSVAYLFNKLGVVHVDLSHNEDQIMDIAIESGAEDVLINDDGSIDVFRRGIERIIERSPVPIIPLHLGGLWGSMFSRKTKWRLPRLKWSLVSVSVGEPVAAQDVNADDLRMRVAQLKAHYSPNAE